MFSQDAATLVGRGVLNPGTVREGLYVLDGVNKNTVNKYNSNNCY